MDASSSSVRALGAALLGLGLCASGSVALARGHNLALNRPTQQSSTSQWSRPNDSGGAVDGVKNGGYGFHTSQEHNPWWQVDLGNRQRLDEVVIYNRQDCCSERARTLRVLLSDDGHHWRQVYAHDGRVFGGVRGGALRVDLHGQAARFVRLQLSGREWFHLDEVEVFGEERRGMEPPPPPHDDVRGHHGHRGRANLALNRPAQQSSSSQWSRPNDAAGAVDGVKNGGYGFHTNQEHNPWWQVDLGHRQRLDEVVIYNRQDCCSERARTLRVLLSEDGHHWRQAYVHDGRVFGGVRGGPLRVDLDGRHARFVRLQLAERQWFHLDEVEIFGSRH